MAGRAPSRRRTVRLHAGARFAVVAARFNEPITKRLLDGALGVLSAAGVGERAADVHWVPGAFELPQAAAYLARTGRYAGIVCVGCVIRGQTPHFDFIAGQAAAGIQRVALDTGIPATFGVITALTEAQAWERAGGEVGNRGAEAAEAAVEMASFVQTFGASRTRTMSRRVGEGRRPRRRSRGAAK
ncbi:MAG TPA: 6,7-dimethyl-8-ribityllumazine synthase [Methylomirabilota bacterium]|jgi:6,7-dimethyl-8-ribityllumazine synthase|nr:6,7-dimethyl-8-ribityllumazine synthase [Methylomirabilota bacterium]